MFGARALRNDLAASGVWSWAEVDAGAPDRASGGDVLAMVRRLPAMALKP